MKILRSIGRKSFAPLMAMTLLLAGCAAENLYQDLDERDANEILVVLYKNGIDAEKTRVEGTQEVTYSIQVGKDELQRSRQILMENSLPRKKQLGFSGICKEKGLIPTPEEEKCRKLLALKGEIINSLERVPGMVDADVVLNLPEISEFSTEPEAHKKPTASAVLRVRKEEAGMEVTESRMQRFISNTVENLDPRDVSVIISYVEPIQKILAEGPQKIGTTGGPVAAPGTQLASLAGLTFHPDSVGRFKIYAVVMLIVLIGVSGALIVNVIKMTKMRQELKVSRAQMGGPGSGTPLLEEGSQASPGQLKSGEREGAARAASSPRA